MRVFHPGRVAARRSATNLVAAMLIALALLPVRSAPAADEVGEALEASLSSQRAARESQQRVNKLDDEAKALRDKRRTVEWKALQQSAYAAQLEEQAAIEEKKRGELESQLARIASTGTDLAPLMARMVSELEAFIEADLPFLSEARRQRVADLKALLADPARGGPEKFRRVLEAHRSEVEYGHSIGAEDSEVDCAGARGEATLVRVGRVGLYCLTPDGKGGYWDARQKRFESLGDDGVAELKRAVVVARGEGPPELLVLPVRAGPE